MQGIIIRYVTSTNTWAGATGISIWMNTATGDFVTKGNMILFLDVKSIAVDMRIEIMCIHIPIVIMSVYLIIEKWFYDECKLQDCFIWYIRIKK